MHNAILTSMKKSTELNLRWKL